MSKLYKTWGGFLAAFGIGLPAISYMVKHNVPTVAVVIGAFAIGHIIAQLWDRVNP